MSRREAERLQEALQQGEQGIPAEDSMAPLVKTAQRVAILAGPVPSAPHRLAPGRQRFLTEAARLREGANRTGPVLFRGNRGRTAKIGALRLATIMAAVVLVVGLLFGAGQVAADSLPGEPLYGLKLALEETQLKLASGADARAELSISHAAGRLDEVLGLAEEGGIVDDAVRNRVENQLMAALQAAAQNETAVATRLLQRLELALAQRLRVMDTLAGTGPNDQVRAQLQQLVRVMERVRVEAHAGQGDPESLRERLRYGLPEASEPVGGPEHGPGPGPQPPAGQGSPGSSADPVPAEKPGQKPASQPSEEPKGPNAPEDPGKGPGPNQTDEPKGADVPDAPAQGPGPNDGQGPEGPQDPGKGSGLNPAGEPGGSTAPDEPGKGPGHRDSEEPGGSNPPAEPGKDSGSGERDNPAPTEERTSKDAVGQGPTAETPGNDSAPKEGSDSNSGPKPTDEGGSENPAVEPEPKKEAAPEPQPTPGPSPNPNPQPTPEPRSEDDPSPSPDPDPSPNPDPSPSPNPDPSPSPEGPGPGPSGDEPKKP